MMTGKRETVTWKTTLGWGGLSAAMQTKLLGEEEGKKVFEWYCSVYHVNIDCYAPSTVRREVFGF